MPTNDIAVSRKQRAFAKLETTAGSLVTVGTGNFIRPVGNAMINQSPAFVNSEELRDTLDVLDQFQDAMPAGTFTLSMYARPSGTIGTAPQGHALFKSMMGDQAATTASISTRALGNATTVLLDNVSSRFPEKGVITVDSEKIYYDGITRSSLSSSTATLTSCTRAYSSTATHSLELDTLVTLSSVFYKQATEAPSFSLWLETDHFVQGLSGAVVNNVVLGVTNSGAIKFDFSGEGMRMYWAGKTTLSAAKAAGAGATSITVSDADNYSTGSYIYNYTQTDYGSSGYKITARNTTTNQLTITPAINNSINWDAADVIKGYLPDTSACSVDIGSPIEGKDTTVKLNNVSSKFKTSDFTFAVPKQFITDEVGTTFPESYVDAQRSISSTMSLYFREADAKYFSEGFIGTNIPIEIDFGDTDGYKMKLYMKKCKLKVPEINFSDPVTNINMEVMALGTCGEDSAEITFN